MAGLCECISSAAFGFGYGTIMSNYRSLDRSDVINHEKLAEVWGTAVANDWTLAVRRLIDEPLRTLYALSHLITVLLIVNGTLALLLWRKVRERRDSTGSGQERGERQGTGKEGQPPI